MRAWIATLLIAGIPGCSPRSAERTSTAVPPVAPPSPAPAAARPPPAEPGPPPGEIITAEIQNMNGDRYGRPAATWNQGSVASIAVPASARTATGFQVQFPSHATITTPTVYDHEVIVSGGFQGKQLFAYAAGTGKPLWGIDLHDDGPSSPACEDGVCVLSTESCTI